MPASHGNKKKLRTKVASKSLWVRVIDRAGNRSRWKKIKVKN
ncbi:MAG: hypothetical protein ACSLFD_04670 [Solirubrobacterales bacterium]